MALVLDGTTGINTVTPAGTSTLVDGMTVGRGPGEISTNTVMGASALGVNTTGDSNAAFGSQALAANTTGYGNTAVGQLSLLSNTTGNLNTALGQSALRLNTTGTYNTAVGQLSLYSNTTASNNTAVGYQAGYSGVTAPRNTSIGYRAGYANTTGYNCFIGTTTGTASTGYGNTFVGSDYANGCGALVTSGNNNTILGGYSGNQGGLDIRTASNYIVLSDGDGNPRHYWTGDGTSYMGFTSTGAIESYISSSCGRANYYNAAGATRSCQYYYYSGVEKGSISISSTATAFNTSSDYRLKNSIAPMTGALAKVAQLKPVTYKWNADGSDGQGFIAHELAEVVPECVTGEKDAVDENGNPKYQGIDVSFLVATLTAAIQEQQAIINELKSRIETLESK